MADSAVFDSSAKLCFVCLVYRSILPVMQNPAQKLSSHHPFPPAARQHKGCVALSTVDAPNLNFTAFLRCNLVKVVRRLLYAKVYRILFTDSVELSCSLLMF